MFKSLLSNSRRQLFFNLIIFNTAYAWSRTFSGSVLNPHFLRSGLSVQQILLGVLFSFIGIAGLMLFVKRISSKTSWRLAIISAFAYILFVARINSLWQFYFASVLSGFVMALLYVAYNIAHYQLTPKHRTSYSSAILFSVFPLVGLVAPLAAGFCAEISYNLIWILSGFFFLLSFYIIRFQKQFLVTIDLKSGFKTIKTMRLFVFLEGIWEALIFGIIPVFSLYFIKSPLYYGTYMAYLSLMAVIANLILGQISDKLKKRLVFLYPVTILMALTTFAFPLVVFNLVFWLILTGVIQFLTPLFWNFSTSMFIDCHPDVAKSMPIREWLLSLGRILGLALVFLNFQVEAVPHLIFFFLGFIMLLYPAILFYNTRISKKYHYL